MPTFEFRIPQDFALCRKKGRDNLAAKNESQNRPINNEEEEKKKTGQADQLVSVSGTVQYEKFGSVSNARLI